jgi:hypothetical protein
MTALINIGKKLPHVPTKEKKSKEFNFEKMRL